MYTLESLVYNHESLVFVAELKVTIISFDSNQNFCACLLNHSTTDEL